MKTWQTEENILWKKIKFKKVFTLANSGEKMF